MGAHARAFAHPLGIASAIHSHPGVFILWCCSSVLQIRSCRLPQGVHPVRRADGLVVGEAAGVVHTRDLASQAVVELVERLVLVTTGELGEVGLHHELAAGADGHLCEVLALPLQVELELLLVDVLVERELHVTSVGATQYNGHTSSRWSGIVGWDFWIVPPVCKFDNSLNKMLLYR